MANKKRIIGIICIVCVFLIFALKMYYPEFRSLINKPAEVKAADEDLDTEEPDKAHSKDDDIKEADEDKTEPDDVEDEPIGEQEDDSSGTEEEDKDKNNDGKGDEADEKIESPIKEFRAAWISTVYNLDWPSKKGLSLTQQKQEFTYLLDKLKKAGLNSVIVQIKPGADSFYPSEYAPWSEYLTGVQGQNPGYNPLTFMIEETHKRGLEFHAWFNPYRISVKDNMEELAKEHPARKNPDWVVNYGNKLYYNPGIPEVRQFVIDSILEVVKNYNIDGVHLDDYFYPYPEKGIDFPDDELYRVSKRFDKETKGQWRRNNINDFIKDLYRSIKKEKANVKFGVSPFGIWRNKSDDPKGSNTQGGITSYDSLYADTKYWVENGWLDYIAPQIYWYFGYDKADYEELVDWWADVVKGHKPHLYIGHAAYKVEAGNTPWGNPLEIINQVKYNRTIPQVKGSIFFRAKSITDNPLGLADKLKNDIYKEKAETP
ncbi:MAG: family 10 glycosylhydrolase [Candidatus Alkaliphilus sp. MAG34]